jgi:hypothetical protein
MNFNWRRRYRPPIIPDVGRAEFDIESKKAAGWAGRGTYAPPRTYGVTLMKGFRYV